MVFVELVMFGGAAATAARRAGATPATTRTREPLELGRVTAAAAARRLALYALFMKWLSQSLPTFGPCLLVHKHPVGFCERIAELVTQCYLEGGARTKPAEALLAVQDKRPFLRGHPSQARRVLYTWVIVEPNRLHAPCLVLLLKAMVVTALAWRWREVAATLFAGFYVWLRPIEHLRCSTADLLLPSEHKAGRVTFVRVREPKTRKMGLGRSHMRIDEGEIVAFWEARCQQVGRRALLFSPSPWVWRRRLSTLALVLTGDPLIIPAPSLRPSAATHFFDGARTPSASVARAMGVYPHDGTPCARAAGDAGAATSPGSAAESSQPAGAALLGSTAGGSL